MKELSPVDLCGCGDTGYLILRTIPVDLAQGLGHIHKVPSYHCGNKLCDQYTLPSPVVSRIDDLADIMEQKELNSIDFYWEGQEEESQNSFSLAEAFIWKFSQRKYEDAEVSFVHNGQTVIFHSLLDATEFYELKYLHTDEKGTWFSFVKFYSEEPLTLENYLDFEPPYTKELGVMNMDEVEETLVDMFGSAI
ncbi:hypothetical protein ACHOLT_15230 [Desulfitobacterium sp. Sab5]|uniref:hypothetical protein n=1 Tax=Desulfitobacterium nosdiversum TaxID=3375356 RepID=UPI003CE84DE9